METKLTKLFDYQKFENNPKLKAICDAVEEKYAQMDELSEEDLGMVAGGRSEGEMTEELMKEFS